MSYRINNLDDNSLKWNTPFVVDNEDDLLSNFTSYEQPMSLPAQYPCLCFKGPGLPSTMKLSSHPIPVVMVYFYDFEKVVK